MPTPSLLIVPARFKSGKLYSQIPTSGAGDFTVTRATAATRVNASGFIESVASGIPRLDYFASGGTVGCPALLVEPSGQNLAFHSETWAAGGNWFLNGTTRATGSTDAFKAPDGTFTANAISPTSGNVQHYLFSNSPTTITTFTSGTIYTQSAFFKAGTGDAGRYVQLTFGSSRFTQLGFANFDLQNGAVVASGAVSGDTNRNARIENYGNGWYRCSLTATCNSNGSTVGVVPVLITASGDTLIPSFSGTVTDVLYGWGAQLETGSIATSYIPTTTGSVTRNADVVTVSGAVSGSIGQTEGTMYAEVDLRNLTAASRILALGDGTTSNRIALSIQRPAGSPQINVVVLSGSVVQANISSANVSAGVFKIAVGYATNDVVFYINGVLVDSDTTVNIPACSQVFLGKTETSASTNFLNDRIRAAALYTTRLTNDQLAALTTP